MGHYAEDHADLGAYDPSFECPEDEGYYRRSEGRNYYSSRYVYVDEVDDDDRDPYLRASRKPYPIDGEFWTTAKGQRLRIRDMSDEHLANAFACTVRREGLSHAQALLRELNTRMARAAR